MLSFFCLTSPCWALVEEDQLSTSVYQSIHALGLLVYYVPLFYSPPCTHAHALYRLSLIHNFLCEYPPHWVHHANKRS